APIAGRAGGAAGPAAVVGEEAVPLREHGRLAEEPGRVVVRLQHHRRAFPQRLVVELDVSPRRDAWHRRIILETREGRDATRAADRLRPDLDGHGGRRLRLRRVPVRGLRAAAPAGDRADPDEDDPAPGPLLAIGPQDLRAARRRASGGDPCARARARAGAYRDVREVREPRLPRVLARDPPPYGRRS